MKGLLHLIRFAITLAIFSLCLPVNVAKAQVKYDGYSFVIDGVLLLQDSQDTTAFFYMPKAPAVAYNKDSTLSFLCMKYVGENQQASGGIFHALFEFSVPEKDLKKVEIKLKKKLPWAKIKGQLKILPNLGQDGTDSSPGFEVISAVLQNGGEGGMTRSLVASGSAPLTPGSKAAVAAVLDPKGATLLWASLDGPTSDISVGVRGYYEAILPAFNAKIVMDSKTVHKAFSTKRFQSTPLTQSDIQRGIDSLIKSGTIKVEIVDRSKGMDIDNASMQALTDLITTKTIDMMFMGYVGPSSGMGMGGMGMGGMGMGGMGMGGMGMGGMGMGGMGMGGSMSMASTPMGITTAGAPVNPLAASGLPAMQAQSAASGLGGGVGVGAMGLPTSTTNDAENQRLREQVEKLEADKAASDKRKADKAEARAKEAEKAVADPVAGSNKTNPVAPATTPTDPAAGAQTRARSNAVAAPSTNPNAQSANNPPTAAPNTNSGSKWGGAASGSGSQPGSSANGASPSWGGSSGSNGTGSVSKNAPASVNGTAGNKMSVGDKAAIAQVGMQAAQAGWGMAKEMMAMYQKTYTLVDQKNIKQSNYTINLSKASSIKVPFYSAGNVSGLFEKLKNDPRYFRTVDMNDPAFQKRDINFVVDGDYAEKRDINFVVDGDYAEAFNTVLNFVTIKFRKAYANGHDTVFAQMVISKNDMMAGMNFKTTFYSRLGLNGKEWNEYEYQVLWSVKGETDPIRYPADPKKWILGTEQAVSLVPPFQKEEIDVDAGRDLFQQNGYISANMNFTGTVAGKTVPIKRLLLRAGDAEWSSKMVVFHDPNKPLTYQTSWYTPEGEIKQPQTVMASNYIFLTPPVNPNPPAKQIQENTSPTEKFTPSEPDPIQAPPAENFIPSEPDPTQATPTENFIPTEPDPNQAPPAENFIPTEPDPNQPNSNQPVNADPNKSNPK